MQRCIRSLFFTLLTLSIVWAAPDPAKNRVIETQKRVVVVDDPKAIVPFGAYSFLWSDAGRYAVIFQFSLVPVDVPTRILYLIEPTAAIKPEHALFRCLIFDSETQTTRELRRFSLNNSREFPLAISRFPNSHKFALVTTEVPDNIASTMPPKTRLYVVDSETSTLRTIFTFSPAEGDTQHFVDFEMSPFSNHLLVIERRFEKVENSFRLQETTTVRTCDQQGKLSSPIVISNGSTKAFAFGKEPNSVYALVGTLSTTTPRKLQYTVSQMDLNTGSLTPHVGGIDLFYPRMFQEIGAKGLGAFETPEEATVIAPGVVVRLAPDFESDVKCLPQLSEYQFGTTKGNLYSLWLTASPENKSARVLLGLSPNPISGSPNRFGTSLLYSLDGTLYFRVLLSMDQEAWNRIKDARAKTEAMNKAKQVATALMIYAADYDDVLPNSSAFPEAVLPYAMNASLFQGFQFLLGGANMTGIEKPAETVLGYVQGPGGFAVAYGDGHVVWMTNLPPGINPPGTLIQFGTVSLALFTS